ncbi:hypothetical protein JCM3774_005022 [Rhodotorula dairenensis]
MASFSLGLDTPSKLFATGPTGLTPASWSLGGTGLTPSILGSFSASGWTPSLTSMTGVKSELNPFEISLSTNSASSSSSSSLKRKTGVDFLDREDAAGASGSPSNSAMFDLLATTPSGGTGRKRALSSPAIEIGCGSSSFPFLSQPSQFHPDSTLSNGGTGSSPARSRRPRMASMQSSALTTAEPFFSSFERESDESPPSSVVLTPPDSAPLYSNGLAANDAPQTGSRDINVVPLSGPSKPTGAPPPAPALAQSTNLLSRLAQERSALIATGAGIAHAQTQPLPIPVKRSSATPASADITVKAEPADEHPSPAPSGLTNSRPAPVTRGQSKRGTRSSLAAMAPPAAQEAPTAYTSFSFGNSSGVGGDSNAPTSVNGSSKRKAPRRKATAAGRKRGDVKEKSASVSAQDGEDDDGEDGGGEGGDDSTKRQQFLERNRVAACKSRQKKKEKVAGLEQFAADLCARNHMLQQTALALRQEAITLRQLVHAHIGCSCEHAQGYIARDAAGGGIATIDQLAGRVLTLDYSVPPAMGTEDDVYSFLDREAGHADGGGALAYRMTASPVNRRSATLPSGSGSAPGPAIPIVAARPVGPAAAAASSASSSSSSLSSLPANGSFSVSPVRRTGMRTRRSSLAVHAAAAADQGRAAAEPTFANDSHDHAAFRAAVTNNHLGLSMDASAVVATTASVGPDPTVRATSAPPTTPGWGDAAPMGDYFAPKRSSTRASIAAVA